MTGEISKRRVEVVIIIFSTVVMGLETCNFRRSAETFNMFVMFGGIGKKSRISRKSVVEEKTYKHKV